MQREKFVLVSILVVGISFTLSILLLSTNLIPNLFVSERDNQILQSPTENVEGISCTDSDDGLNYLIKGTVVGTEQDGNSIFEDLCLYKTQTEQGVRYIKIDECSAPDSNCILQEGFCSNNEIVTAAHSCEGYDFCREGICAN